MTEKQSSYRQIMKATSLFGGVQVFSIIISILRSKFIAILLGPSGMGIAGLLTSTTSLINGLTNFGLGTSAVKDVASANATGNEYRIAIIIKVVRRLVWITGSFGALAVLVLSGLLSKMTFGNNKYTVAFIWMSVTLLFQQITSGQMVVLQGMRKLQYLAKANITGSIIGLMVSLPIYYFYGINGIVPAIILSSFAAMLLSMYFSHKVSLVPVKISPIRTIAEGKDMLKMGFMISLTGLMGLGIAYLVGIFIRYKGGVAQVGLYNAGFAIINTYVGLVFTAMATDYYPRLSGVSQNNVKTIETINQQAEIAILILAPILSAFLVLIHWIVIILYSTKFKEINEMIHWAALGMFFKAASWAVAFILLAKGASKVFFWNELTANFYVLIFNIAGYEYWGLKGLGISFLIGYVVYFVQIFIIAQKKYTFYFERQFYKIFVIQVLLAILCFGVMKLMISPFSYIMGIILIIFSTIYSYSELDKRMDMNTTLRAIKNKFLSLQQ